MAKGESDEEFLSLEDEVEVITKKSFSLNTILPKPMLQNMVILPLVQLLFAMQMMMVQQPTGIILQLDIMPLEAAQRLQIIQARKILLLALIL